MITLLALLVAAPSEPLAGQVRAAIWHDLQTNALIGNGNWLASLWYNAGSETAPNLHIQDLRCESREPVQQCSFTLHRDGGVVEVMGKKAPDRLGCDATFVRPKDEAGWAVKHIPPQRAGHSQTTMRCKPVPA